MRRALLLAVALAPAIGCSTAAQHPELVARVSQVRVVRDPESVRGCSFLRAVSATEDPGYTTSRGLQLVAGTPAITTLQLRALQAGGDAVEVTNSERTYRAGGTRAQTLTTLTGNAYRCAQGVGQASTSSAPSRPEQGPSTAVSSGSWHPLNDTNTEGRPVSGILVVANDGRTNLSFVCHDAARGRVLSAGIAIGRSAKPNSGAQETATIQLRFDGEAAISIPIVREDEGRYLRFYGNDVSELANLMRMHDLLLVGVWFEDGSSEVFEFDVRGFFQAARSTSAGCDSR